MIALRRAVMIAALAACTIQTRSASAQAPASGSSAGPARPGPRSADCLAARNRSRMYHGDPLVIVGLEQGRDDIRASTPVLEQSDRATAYVDQDDNYKRTLAMYEDRTTFHDPLSSRVEIQPDGAWSPTAPAQATPTPRVPRATATESQNEPSATDAILTKWPWLLGAGTSALFAALFLKRFGFAVLRPGAS
jgi:hypothetical protein